MPRSYFRLEAAVSDGPKDTKAKIEQAVKAWETLASTAKFAGMTLAEFKTAMQPSQAARDLIATLDDQMTAAIIARENADKASMEKLQFVVKSVAGDPAFGENSALYEALGYVRKSDRKSGLTHKDTDHTPNA